MQDPIDGAPRELAESAKEASQFLKGVANANRLLILCALAEGERSVSELEAILKLRQPTLSQQLARLREEGIVRPRRQGKSIYYRIADPAVHELLSLLYRLFCASGSSRRARPTKDESELTPL